MWPPSARLMYLNYPNNPTGAVVPEGLFERAVQFAREHDLLVVHDASYTETTFDGYVAPSFLQTPGAKDVGVEVFSLSKGYNMTGWRTAAHRGQRGGGRGLLEAQDQHRLGHARGGAAGGGGCARRRRRCRARDERHLPAPARPGGRCADRDRRGRGHPEGHHLRLGARSGRAHARPPTASWCWSSPGWWSRRGAPTARTARASSVSPSRCRTSAWARRSSGCASSLGG